jgi:pimeloyl-ACP methyl ester carboxylesterase
MRRRMMRIKENCKLYHAGVIVSLVLGVATLALAAAPPFRAEVSGGGRPLLLIPGLNSSGAVWNGLVDHLKGRFTCHALTLPGFAEQPPLAAPSLVTVRDAILAYIDEHRLERPILIGHSLGAFLAFWVASTSPTKVGSVIAIDGVPFLPALMDLSATVDSVRVQAESMRKVMENASKEQRERTSALSLASMISDPAHVAMAQRWAVASDPRTTALSMWELMTTDLRAEVSRIETPVLLVAAGAQFAANPSALAALEQSYERQVAGIARHRTVVARQARHFVMLDDPAFLSSTIAEFLGR